jgi:Mycotoxin biosynthesis protein UstYa
VAKDIDTTPRLVTTNGSLNWPSIYRQPPSQEADDAWNEISYNSKWSSASNLFVVALVHATRLVGVFSLPEEMALEAGLERGDVRIPAGYQGSGEYMASLELTHQLHCVVCFKSHVSFPVRRGCKKYHNR